MIFTIGYQAMKPARLVAIARHLDCTVIDCRCSLRSRIAGFGGRQLTELFEREGVTYAQHGDKLGGRGQTTAAGIDLLRTLFYDGNTGPAPKPNCLLLCLEDGPWDCHRHEAIVRPHFPDALHIFSELFYTPADIERAMVERKLPPSRGEVFPSDQE